MSYFVCLHRPGGDPVTERDRDRVSALISKKGLRRQPWLMEGSFAATAVGTRLGSSPSIVSVGSLFVAGTVRLDNREELVRDLGGLRDASDLEIVGTYLRERGSRSLDELIGDFVFVCWDSRTHTLLAARDSLGVRHLFWSSGRDGLTAFGSHASLLADGGACSLDYIARTFSYGDYADLTIYEGVRRVPAASTVTMHSGRVVVDRYWSPENVPAGGSPTRTEAEHCDEFSEVFQQAVSRRLPDGGCVWAELSGGLDTSSIVMTSELLHRRGAVSTRIAGTITYADSLGSGDESQYVNAILAESGLPNQELRDYCPWQDDGEYPSETEFPASGTIFWASSRRKDRLLQNADVVLSGAGGDYVVAGNPYFFADWVAQGQVVKAWREMVRWAALGRQSIWQLAMVSAIAPLLPQFVRSRVATEDDPVVPSWVNADFRRQYAMDDHARSRRVGRLRRKGGQRYYEVLANQIKSVEFASPQCHPLIDYEWRYPFLDRRLAELVLRLPPEMLIRPPVGQKRVLREAMRGVLPEIVRMRRTKGSFQSRLLWGLEHERKLIEWMLREPVLAEMGCVDPSRLRTAFAEASSGRAEPQDALPILRALYLETWLRIRSGRWLIRAGSLAQFTRTLTTAGRTYEHVPDAAHHQPGIGNQQDGGDEQWKLP
jgi:asparagine synthase (glutamine-hydrolysing)